MNLAPTDLTQFHYSHIASLETVRATVYLPHDHHYHPSQSSLDSGGANSSPSSRFFFFSAPANLLITKSLCSSPSALPIFSLNITQAQLQGPLLGGARHELHLVAVIAVQPDKRDVPDKFSAKFPPRPTIVPLCRQKVLPVSGIYVSSFGAALGTASRARFPDQGWADRVLARPNGLKFELEQQVELAQTFVLVWIFVGAGDGDVEAAACGEDEVRAGSWLCVSAFSSL